ncbi:hypothetical protein SDJN02_10654, partial [Cucurbita argyrosperma subsp. argyrosperma]
MNAAGSSQRHRQEQRAYRALCCRCTCHCRLRFSSSEETESFGSERFPSDSSISHAMDQMIREKQRIEETKFVVMVAMEKCSNGIEKPKDLRSLLNCYISMNSDECHGVILEEMCDQIKRVISTTTSIQMLSDYNVKEGMAN